VISAATGPDPAPGWQPEIVVVEGRFVEASNATLLAVTAAGEQVIYKPIAGERPLWDFPAGTLAAREVLTYEVATTMGLDLVPETVMGDGLYGPGSVQRYVDIDEDFDPLPLVRRGAVELWPVAVLDAVCNNADRKLGHLLREQGSQRLVAVDHGLTFHVEDKLRTVIWAFAGRALTPELSSSLTSLAETLSTGLGDRVAEMLSTEESVALSRRVEELLGSPLPHPPDDRPAIPWPPY
jgi:hypothetical protein